MADWTGFTNQNLYQARLLANQLEAAGEGASPALKSALAESAIHRLMIAYRSYLNELGQKYRLPRRVELLSELVDSCPVLTSEIKQLQILEKDQGSWLNELLASSELIGWPVIDVDNNDRKVNGAELGVALITSDRVARPKVDTGALAKVCLSSLEALIDQQRALTVEF